MRFVLHVQKICKKDCKSKPLLDFPALWSIIPVMKTVTKRQAAQKFATLADLAHGGEEVLVTDAGKPWIKLAPISKTRRPKSASVFRARLRRISKKPVPGVVKVLPRLRG